MEELAKGKHVFQAALQWSAVLLNRTKARIKPLCELNRTAASVASGNNEMPTFLTPSTQKISCKMLEGKKITWKRILEETNFIVNQGVEKKFMTRPNHPTPSPPRQKSNGRPLISNNSSTK